MIVAFRILFLTLSNVKVNFNNKKLRWRSYTTAKTFPTTRQMELVGKKKFIIAALNLEDKIFVVYVMFFAIFDTNRIHLFRRAQIASS